MSLFDCVEVVFEVLLPPACREHILGDLRQKYKSTREYLMAGLALLAPVIGSRIRRTTDFQLCLMEIFAVYLSFAAAAWYLGQISFLYDQTGFARLAIPTTVAVISLLLSNAYADPEKKSPLLRPILQSAGSIVLSFCGQAFLFDTNPALGVPVGILLCGSITGVVLVATLRMLFIPALPNRSAHRTGHNDGSVPLVGCAAAILIAVLLIFSLWHRY